ncbi:MAG: PhoH family protein [Syntrophomonadaceae bacterium]|nr:PhoH family protein [Syntrophomonadaceae bacterium]
MADHEIKISIGDNRNAAVFFGAGDENFKYLKNLCNAEVYARGGDIFIRGEEEHVEEASELIHSLIDVVENEGQLNINNINYMYTLLKRGDKLKHQDIVSGPIIKTVRGKHIKAKTIGQRKYIEAIIRDDIVFGIGPAGTGKTYLAVVMAVRALKNKEVERIILVRPAVEAGEKLGFLPGDLIEKVNPYLRPLYDSLFDILGVEVTQRYMEKNIIEVAPLAYMRGRTLNDAFIILDEAQNTTPQQMKMFLTRLGFGSKAVITGDITQVDLPKEDFSGLIEVQKILKNIKGVSFEYLTKDDVIRHPLVQKIIDAYDSYEQDIH